MTQRYKLLKDLPGYKAGTEFQESVVFGTYAYVVDGREVPKYISDLIANETTNSDFFEPIETPPSRYTVRLVQSAWEQGTMTIEVELGKPPKEQAEAICEAIRAVLAYIHKPTEANHQTMREKAMDAANEVQKENQ